MHTDLTTRAASTYVASTRQNSLDWASPKCGNLPLLLTSHRAEPTNLPPPAAYRIHTPRHITRTIVINAPAQAVYNRCVQFDEFSPFALCVISVRGRAGDDLALKLSFWPKPSKSGKDGNHWNSRPQSMSSSISLYVQRGIMSLVSEGRNTTRLTVELDYEQPYHGPAGTSRMSPDAVERLIEGTLKRFRRFTESQPLPAGDENHGIDYGLVTPAGTDFCAWTQY